MVINRHHGFMVAPPARREAGSTWSARGNSDTLHCRPRLSLTRSCGAANTSAHAGRRSVLPSLAPAPAKRAATPVKVRECPASAVWRACDLTLFGDPIARARSYFPITTAKHWGPHRGRLTNRCASWTELARLRAAGLKPHHPSPPTASLHTGLRCAVMKCRRSESDHPSPTAQALPQSGQSPHRQDSGQPSLADFWIIAGAFSCRGPKTSLPTSKVAKPATSTELMAAREVVKLAPEVSPRDVVEVVGAMIMMRIMRSRAASNPTRRFGCSWRVAFGASPTCMSASVGITHGNACGGAIAKLSPRGRPIPGHWLATALGIAGQGLAKAEQAERDSRTAEAGSSRKRSRSWSEGRVAPMKKAQSRRAELKHSRARAANDPASG